MSKDIKKVVKKILKKKQSPIDKYIQTFCKDCQMWHNPCDLTRYGSNFMFFCICCKVGMKGLDVLDSLGDLLAKAGEELLNKNPSMVV